MVPGPSIDGIVVTKELGLDLTLLEALVAMEKEGHIHFLKDRLEIAKKA